MWMNHLPHNVARFRLDDVHCGTSVVEAEVLIGRVGVHSSRLHSTEQLNMLFMCFVWTLRLRQRHRRSLTLHQWWRKRKRWEWILGILCVNVCVAIDTMLNFDDDANAYHKCEQAYRSTPAW